MLQDDDNDLGEIAAANSDCDCTVPEPPSKRAKLSLKLKSDSSAIVIYHPNVHAKREDEQHWVC